MNDQELIETYAGQPVESLPAEVREKVEADPTLLSEFHEQARIAALMGLKRFEIPNPDRMQEIRAAISDQVAGVQPRKNPMLYLDEMPNWMRMAAAVVVMLGLSVLTHREMLKSPSEDLVSTLITEAGGAGSPEGIALQDNAPPAYLLNNQDPFTSVVSFPGSKQQNVFNFTPELSQQIQESFLQRSLMETNQVYHSPLMPVRFDLRP
jgi:hypothetical protein